MQSLLRFFLVMVLVFGTVLLWKPQQKSSVTPPPPTDGRDPQEEVKRSLAPLGLASLQKEWSKEEFQARIGDAFERNDPCSALALLKEEAPVSPEERWAAGMAVMLARQRERDPLLEELFATEDSPLLGKPNEGSRKLETRFFNALLFSNQLEGYDENSENPHRNPHRSMEKAIQSFRELVEEDPENGVYSYFLAQTLRYVGTKKEEVESTYSQAAKAPRFNAFYQGIYDSLLSASYENMAAFAWVYTFLQSAPIPDFSVGTRNLRYWASQSDTGRWIASRMAKRLIDTGASYKSTSPGYLYSQVEYILGQGLKNNLDGTPEFSWEEYNKRMREAKSFISETPEALGLAEMDLYREIFEGKGECRWASWEALFNVYREKRS